MGSLNNVSSVSAIRPPQDVTLTAAEVHGDDIIIRWEAAEGAEKYEVLRRISGSTGERLAYTSGTAYKDTTAEWGGDYYYTVRAMAGSVVSAGYDGDGLYARITKDQEVLDALSRAMRGRIRDENAGTYSLDEMISREFEKLEPYRKSHICEDRYLESAFNDYSDGLDMELDAVTYYGTLADAERSLVNGYLACSEAITDLTQGGYFTGENDADIREYYVDTLPSWQAMAVAYQDLYDDIFSQLLSPNADWKVSSDGSYLYETYTNNTSYTITTLFYVDFSQGDNYIGSVECQVSNLAPGKTATIRANIPSNADSFFVDWTHIKITKGSTVIADFS